MSLYILLLFSYTKRLWIRRRKLEGDEFGTQKRVRDKLDDEPRAEHPRDADDKRPKHFLCHAHIARVFSRGEVEPAGVDRDERGDGHREEHHEINKVLHEVQKVVKVALANLIICFSKTPRHNGRRRKAVRGNHKGSGDDEKYGEK